MNNIEDLLKLIGCDNTKCNLLPALKHFGLYNNLNLTSSGLNLLNTIYENSLKDMPYYPQVYRPNNLVVKFKKVDIYILLCKMLFLKSDTKSLCLKTLYTTVAHEIVAIERLKCFIAYFIQIEKNPKLLEGELVVTRNHGFGGWKEWSPNLEDTYIPEIDITSTKKIEDSNADLHVDFANKNIHIGRIIASATQEEILFSCSPELFILMQYVPELKASEAIIVDNVYQFSNYNGYLKSFKYTGLNTIDKVKSICVIDSMVHYSFHTQVIKDNFMRDLYKCYLGFKDYKWVSTGNWGCGVFGCDPAIKFTQQYLVARICRIKLDYSTFGNSELEAHLKNLYQMYNTMSISEILKKLLN
jgi:hypothetical protein